MPRRRTQSPAQPPFVVSSLRTDKPVRHLHASELNVDALGTPSAPRALSAPRSAAPARLVPQLSTADEKQLLADVQAILDDGYAGVIFSGPPGTGKSWYARQVAAALVDGDPERVRRVQFHQSYQYEDWIYGYVPQEGGGFAGVKKHLLLLCEVAQQVWPKRCVMIIDELSRSDPGRVFGEALTYLEKDYRGEEFYVAAGVKASIPRNVVFVATMNPLDRAVDEVDAAFERRFAKYPLNPDEGRLVTILTHAPPRGNGIDDANLVSRIVGLFRQIQEKAQNNEYGAVGHAYFKTVRDEPSLRRLWTFQLLPHLRRAYRLDDGWKDIQAVFDRTFPAPATTSYTAATGSGSAPIETETETPRSGAPDGDAQGRSATQIQAGTTEER